ncbi:MAG: hypothetical protein D6761_13960 [Candidatus Dadabacteria bacterium]|nr:MAG: hypothetical protein D6761_13960 [Candidatus Dadabacteria bacterium]
MKIRYVFLLALGLIPAFDAAAFTLHGGLKNESAYFVSGEKRWDKVQNRLELEPEVTFGNWQFRGRGLIWYDAAMDIEPTRAPDLTSAIKRHYRTAAEIKEAYLLYEGDAFDLRLGWQQIVWGKTDGLRMLDIVNPLDLREFILDDFLDSRIGLFAGRLNWYPDTDIEQEIELLVIPDARPAKAAPAGSRWAFATPPVSPGLTLRILPPEEPNWAPKNTEAGLAWRANVSGWDVSLNYFYGWKDAPNALRRILPGVLELKLKHFRMHTLGGSFSNAFGAFVLRGEMAANLKEGIDRLGASFADTVARKTTLNAALAVEWTKYNWTISPQFFIRRITGWEPALLEARTTGFWTLRVATDFMHEKLKPEVLLIADWADGGWLARPKIAYEWSDQITTTLGADIFGGHAGFIGQFANNDRIYAEAEYTF